MTLEDLLKLPEELIEKAHAAIVERRNERYRSDAKTVETRIALAERGYGDFKPEELNYAGTMRCACGHGMAYPEKIGMGGAWYCSAILKGEADRDVTHTGAHPFTFWSIKSETQAGRVGGRTTRPADEPLHPRYLEECVRCNVQPQQRTMPAEHAPKDSGAA